MASKIFSSAVIGLNAKLVEVEADTGGGELGHFTIVGLPDLSVTESRERVKSAIRNSGLIFPKVKITVNLAPADLKKHGPSYDLPIAISILVATDKLPVDKTFDNSIFVGELALDGSLRPIQGVLPIALTAKAKGKDIIFVPTKNADEAKLVKDLTVIPVDNLSNLAAHLKGKIFIKPTESRPFDFSNPEIINDMSHVKGQEHVKRAIEIAAAGAHNLMMSGPPGSGKTLIARTMPSILPDLSLDEALEITKIYSIAGHLPSDSALITARPFRSPHHTASGVALVGGGTWPRPGEISLSHRGVLFLDEFGEFSRSVLENLRQPLEDGVINISRAAGSLSFPAKFVLVAAMNPCPCGFLTDQQRPCVCSPSQIINYRKKISGPIIDRIDMHIEVPRINFEKLSTEQSGETSKSIKKRVQRAREIQHKRFKEEPILTNSEMISEAVKKHCCLNDSSRKILKTAVEQMHLSARSYFRILKLSRTIADLAEADKIDDTHLAEALQYRPKEN